MFQSEWMLRWWALYWLELRDIEVVQELPCVESYDDLGALGEAYLHI
jgi:hypothetical protein